MKTVALGLLGALLGVGVFVVGRHLYIDHYNLHAIVAMVQQAQAAQAAKH